MIYEIILQQIARLFTCHWTEDSLVD